MALFGEIPRGLQQFYVKVLTGDTPGSNIAVPGIRGFNFTVESDSDTLEGDNAVIATVRNPKSLTGSIELGRLNLAGMAAMVGGTVGSAGSTPNVILTLDESSAAGTQYFQAQANTFSQDSSGSGYRVIAKKLLITSGPDESMTVNEWNTPTLDFNGVAISDVLLSRKGYETYVALS
jgi:hypothetical protein